MSAAVELYWLPLGAGGHCVRLNGVVYEALAARIERRTPSALYHSALIVRLTDVPYAIEMTPVRDGRGVERGVVAEGAVGTRWTARLRLLRYEIRRWRNGVIPDAEEAVNSPRVLTREPAIARRVLELVPQVPTPVWGRDELGTGEMWKSHLGRPGYEILHGGGHLAGYRHPVRGRAARSPPDIPPDHLHSPDPPIPGSGRRPDVGREATGRAGDPRPHRPRPSLRRAHTDRQCGFRRMCGEARRPTVGS
jgi:hypothetical protein